jgi:hypothetical protein
MTPNSGRVSFYLDGQPLPLGNGAVSIDLHSPYGTLLRSIDLKPVDLVAGECVLAVESLDEPDPAGKSEIGVDFIWVQDR